MAKRIQRKRTKGWQMPENAVYVGRPTRWGNPFALKEYEDCYEPDEARKFCVNDFATWLDTGFPNCDDIRQYDEKRKWILDHVHELRGKDLACWCPAGQPCHADVLLRLANYG